MSIVAFAVRTATIRAIKGATLAGTNVFDSPVDPSDMAATASAPSIFVFSDMELLGDVEVRDVLSGSRTIDLSLLIVLPATFEATLGGQTVTFQDRKAGAAVAIDIIYRQIERALLDEASPWSALWNVLVTKIVEIEAHAYVLPVNTDKKTTRLPARAVRIQIEPVNNPRFGHEPEHVWADLIALLAADTDAGHRALAPMIAAAIEGEALPEWRVDALEVGDTVEDAQLIGDAPLGGGPMDNVVPMVDVTAEVRIPDETTEGPT